MNPAPSMTSVLSFPEAGLPERLVRQQPSTPRNKRRPTS